MDTMIVGVCKNADAAVRKTYFKLSTIKPLDRAKWVIVESNSNTASKRNLQDFAKITPAIQLICLSEEDKSSSRIERITRARNRYVEEIRVHKPKKVVVVDFDSLLVKFVRIPTEFFGTSNADIVTATQKLCYFDVFAFREKGKDHNQKMTYYSPLLRWFLEIVPKQISLTRRSRKKIEVGSAFGGLAIYPGEIFQSLDYQSVSKQNPICEHVSLNLRASELGYSCFIEPKLVYGFANEHCFLVSPLIFLSRLIRGQKDSFKTTSISFYD